MPQAEYTGYFICKECKNTWGKLSSDQIDTYCGPKRQPMPACPKCGASHTAIRSDNLLADIFPKPGLMQKANRY